MEYLTDVTYKSSYKTELSKFIQSINVSKELFFIIRSLL